MKLDSSLYISVLIIGSLFSANAIAADPSPVEFKDPTGVEIVFLPDGSDWLRIKSRGESDLLIGDNRDVMDAYRKATLKAKAEIVKFMNEKLKTAETMDEMTKTMTENNGQSQSVNRKTMETLTTSINNSAEAILKGVLTIEQSVDKVAKVARVTVGVSRKSMKVADGLSNAIKTDQSTPQNRSVGGAGSPNSEIRRSKNADTF